LVSEHVQQLAEHVSLVPEHMVVAFMPAPLYAEFNRKAAHLDMPVSILASTLLNVIATSDLYKAGARRLTLMRPVESLPSLVSSRPNDAKKTGAQARNCQNPRRGSALVAKLPVAPSQHTCPGEIFTP
jgi:hypothetical protein